MIRSGAKLLFLACVPLGGFVAGAMYHYIRQPEVYAFFLAAGVGVSLLGALGFANLEREEGERHGRTIGRLPPIPGREG